MCLGPKTLPCGAHDRHDLRGSRVAHGVGHRVRNLTNLNAVTAHPQAKSNCFSTEMDAPFPIGWNHVMSRPDKGRKPSKNCWLTLNMLLRHACKSPSDDISAPHRPRKHQYLVQFIGSHCPKRGIRARIPGTLGAAPDTTPPRPPIPRGAPPTAPGQI